MADYLVTSRSDNTNVKYFSYFKKWENFIKIQEGCALPASPIHVALYLTDLMDKHYSYMLFLPPYTELNGHIQWKTCRIQQTMSSLQIY